MNEKPCYKEDSLRDFVSWAQACGHYVVVPLAQNYRQYLSGKEEESSEPDDA